MPISAAKLQGKCPKKTIKKMEGKNDPARSTDGIDFFSCQEYNKK